MQASGSPCIKIYNNASVARIFRRIIKKISKQLAHCQLSSQSIVVLMILKRTALMVIICNHISWSCFGRYTLRQKLNNNYNHCRWSLFYEQLPSAQWKLIPSSIKRIVLFFLLKDNCFIEFCCFLSNLNMNQP